MAFYKNHTIMRNFRNYDIWKMGIELAVSTYKLVDNNFPKEEKFGLSSQVKRASVSIPSNIAEGCSRTSEKEFNRFIEIALGSSFELETQFIIAKKIGYLNTDSLNEINTLLNKEQRMLNALRNTLLKKNR